MYRKAQLRTCCSVKVNYTVVAVKCFTPYVVYIYNSKCPAGLAALVDR